MKTNIEKLNKVPKNTPEVSPKALVDKVNKKKLVSEKGPSEAKPRRSRKKVEEEPIPELPQLDMRPLDEQEDLDHTKKGTMSRKQWKTPENIPTEPEVFEFTEPERDVYAEGNEYPTADEERAQLEMIEQHNLETFGTKDQSKIGMILAEKYLNNEADVETLPPNPDFPLDNFDKYNFQTQQVHPQRSEKVHGNPNSYELRKPRREKNSGHDYGNGAREGQRQGFLNKIKNLWHELKADTKSIAEELGWDEEKELEKQAHEYKNHLKETPTRPDQDYYDLDKAA